MSKQVSNAIVYDANGRLVPQSLLTVDTPTDTVNSIKADSHTPLMGDVQLISGTNVTLTESGQAITIAASTVLTPPAGSANQLQYNGGSGFAADPSVEIDPNNHTLKINASASTFAEIDFYAINGTTLRGDLLVKEDGSLVALESTSGHIQLNPASGKGVGIGTTTPKGILDITSTTQGILIPSMTTTQANALVSASAPSGTLLFGTPTNGDTVVVNNDPSSVSPIVFTKDTTGDGTSTFSTAAELAALFAADGLAITGTNSSGTITLAHAAGFGNLTALTITGTGSYSTLNITFAQNTSPAPNTMIYNTTKEALWMWTPDHAQFRELAFAGQA